jgi:hypothetical protein
MARDWRDAEDYADLASLDLASLAWEFLRRNPQYRRAHAAWTAGLAGEPAGWGLRFPAPPDQEAPEAPVFWRAEIAPAHVIILAPSGLGGLTRAELLGLSRAHRAALDGLHLRFAGGLQAVAPADAPEQAPLAATAALDPDLAVRLTGLGALERLLADRRPGPDPLSPQGRRRALQMLRALDARLAGASYREVAQQVLGAAVEAAAWRTASARDVAIRLCRSARRLMGGGYRGLLLRRR